MVIELRRLSIMFGNPMPQYVLIIPIHIEVYKQRNISLGIKCFR